MWFYTISLHVREPEHTRLHINLSQHGEYVEDLNISIYYTFPPISFKVFPTHPFMWY